MNKYFKFEPVMTLTACQTLAGSIILVLAYIFAWPAVVIGLAAGVVSAFFLFLATFVRGAVTPNATLEQLRNLPAADLAALAALSKGDK